VTDDPATLTPERDLESAPGGSPTRRSFVRRVFYLVSTALIVLAGFAVPLPYVETQPGNPTEIAPLVEIEGIETTELTGTSSLLTIRNRDQAILPALVVLLSPDRNLRSLQEVYPPGIDRDDYHAAQRDRFRRQFEVAAAMGAQAAGVEVDITTAVAVANVLPDGPADGLLLPGDILTEVDGQQLDEAVQLQEITHGGTEGQELVLTVLRNGDEQQVVATLQRVPGEDGPRLGVVIEDGVRQLQLPFDVTLRDGTRIGGPSAGLMVALTVYDLLSDEDLLRGRTIVGTGTMSAEGTVGIVGGVPEKMRAAAAYDADLVLVPLAQIDVALEAAPEDLRVVGVATLDDALEVLRDDG
jgi:Lon-like protease